MSKDRMIMDCLLKDRPNLDVTKEFFFEHWASIFLIGPVNYFSLTKYIGIYAEAMKEYLALWLLGAATVLDMRDRDDGPITVEQAWNDVQFFLEVILPEGVKVVRPAINVEYTLEGGAA